MCCALPVGKCGYWQHTLISIEICSACGAGQINKGDAYTPEKLSRK